MTLNAIFKLGFYPFEFFTVNRGITATSVLCTPRQFSLSVRRHQFSWLHYKYGNFDSIIVNGLPCPLSKPINHYSIQATLHIKTLLQQLLSRDSCINSILTIPLIVGCLLIQEVDCFCLCFLVVKTYHAIATLKKVHVSNV